MKIALRTSGGRGEYELAGRQGDILASDLFDHQIIFEITPSIQLQGHSYAKYMQGKPRIRLAKGGIHAYRILTAILLLPLPIRELGKTSEGSFVLRDGKFSIFSIQVDVVRAETGKVVLRPTYLLLQNRSRAMLKINFPDRMNEILKLWDAASSKDDPISELIRAHRASIIETPSDHKKLEKASKAIKDLISTEEDILPELLRRYDINPIIISPDEEEEQDEADIEKILSENDFTTPVEAARRNLRKWRKLAIRGHEGTVFRRLVTKMYNSTCVISGLRLPKISVTSLPGVDAAHILPWSQYEINHPSNGLCLTKLCHWAFDNGILRLDYDSSEKLYVVSIPKQVIRSASAEGFDLKHFAELTGPIPAERLPRQKENWPKPQYLKINNDIMYEN